MAVFCDVQNTLIAPLIIEYGTEVQKEKYLRRIHSDWVGLSQLIGCTALKKIALRINLE